MTFNQFNFMENYDLVSLVFAGIEICVNINKAINFQRYLEKNFPDSVEKVDFTSCDYCVYIRRI